MKRFKVLSRCAWLGPNSLPVHVENILTCATFYIFHNYILPQILQTIFYNDTMKKVCLKFLIIY